MCGRCTGAPRLARLMLLLGLVSSQHVDTIKSGVSISFQVVQQTATLSSINSETSTSTTRRENSSYPDVGTNKPIVTRIPGNTTETKAPKKGIKKSGSNDEQNHSRHTNVTVPTLSPSKCNFFNQSVKIAVSPQPPLVDCEQNVEGEWTCFGSNVELIKILADRLNFTIDWLVIVPPQIVALRNARSNITTLSSIQVNETASSSLVLVKGGKALMSANGLVRTDNRIRQLTLTEPFDIFTFHFLLSKSVRDHDQIFVKPFSADSWFCILLSAVIIVPVFYFLNTTSRYPLIASNKFLRHISTRDCLVKIGEDLKSYFGIKVTKQTCVKTNNVGENKLSNDAVRKVRLKLKLEKLRAKRRARIYKRTGFSTVSYVIWYVCASLSNQGGETEDLPRADCTRVLVAFWWLYLVVIVATHSGVLTAILTFPRQNDFVQTLQDFIDSRARGELVGNQRVVARTELSRLAVDKRAELAQLMRSNQSLSKSPLQVLKDSVSGEFKFELAFVDVLAHTERLLDEVASGRCALMGERANVRALITHEYTDVDDVGQQRLSSVSKTIESTVSSGGAVLNGEPRRGGRCRLKASKFAIAAEPMVLAVSDRLPKECLKVVNELLRKVAHAGLGYKWRRDAEPLSNDCLDSVVINAGDVAKVELRHVLLASWILGAGIALGGLLLFLEVAWFLTAEPGSGSHKWMKDDFGNGRSESSSSLDSSLSSSSISSSSSSSVMSFGSSDSSFWHLAEEAARDKSNNLAVKISERRNLLLAARLERKRVARQQKPTKSTGRAKTMSTTAALTVAAATAADNLAIATRKPKAANIRQRNLVAKTRAKAAARRKAQLLAAKRRMKRAIEFLQRVKRNKLYAGVVMRSRNSVQQQQQRRRRKLPQ